MGMENNFTHGLTKWNLGFQDKYKNGQGVFLLLFSLSCLNYWYRVHVVILTLLCKTAHILLHWHRLDSSQECRLSSEEGNMADTWVMTSFCLLALNVFHSHKGRQLFCYMLCFFFTLSVLLFSFICLAFGSGVIKWFSACSTADFVLRMFMICLRYLNINMLCEF